MTDRHLVESKWEGANIREVVNCELRAFGDDAIFTRATVRGSDIVVKPSVAQNVKLAVHELPTNAMKHGALSHDTGSIEVELVATFLIVLGLVSHRSGFSQDE